MARTSKRVPKKSKREVELERELAHMQRMVESAALGNSRMSGPQRSVGDLWVGVRNISDLTVGIRSPFPNEPDLQLYANIGAPDPGQVAVISYAWWLQLRKHKHVANGLLMRDDEVLGGSWAPAPADRPEDLPPNYGANHILDPVEWVASRTEAEIRDGIAAINSTAALYRLRRAVDDQVRTYQDEYEFNDPQRAVKAYQRLSAIYQLVDTLTSQRLTDAITS